MITPPVQPQVASLIDSELDAALFAGELLLTANQRQYRAYEATYNRLRLKQGAVAWATPSILTFDAWLQSLFRDVIATDKSTLELLTEAEELYLWKSVVYGTAEQPLLSMHGTSQLLATTWKVQHAWGNTQAEFDDYPNQDHQFYREATANYKLLTEDRGLIDSARLPDVLIPLLPDLLRELPESIWLAGFLQITPQQQRILSALEKIGISVRVNYQPEAIESKVVLSPAPDSDVELAAAARWARDRLEQTSGYIGIVIPDLHLRRAEIMRAFDAVFFPAATPMEIESRGRPFDISYGQTLHQSASVETALLCLSLAFSHLEGNEITRLLLSPHLAGADAERVQRSALDSKLRQDGVRQISLARLLNRCEGLAPVLHKQFSVADKKASRSSALPSVWLVRIANVLKSVGWPGAGLSSAEHQAVEAWQTLLEQLGRFDDLTGELDRSGMLALVREQTSSRLFQPQTDDLRIQILGALEGQGLRFDALWVSGLDNESWPMMQPVSAFLPFEWQRDAGVPGTDLEQDLERARQSIHQWCESAAEVVFSHAMQRDGNELSAARQVSGFSTIPALELVNASAGAVMETVCQAVEIETLEDNRGPATVPSQAVRGGARLFEDQASCPFKAFATHRLAIRPLEEPLLGLDPREKGRVFHTAMELFWNEMRTHAALVELTEDELLLKVETVIQQAMESVRHESEALLSMEHQRLATLILSWLKTVELTRHPFEVMKTEDDLEIVFENLSLKLQVDRLDQVDGFGTLVVDYKTGTNNPIKNWQDERITSPQLPLYAINQEDTIGVCFAQVAKGQCKIIGVAEDKSIAAGLRESDDWPAQVDNWRVNLSTLAKEIREGFALVTPSTKACAYCSLPGLCRINPNTNDLDDGNVGSAEARGAPEVHS